MKLTKKEAIKLFRKHWTWLAKTGSEYNEAARKRLAKIISELPEREIDK